MLIYPSIIIVSILTSMWINTQIMDWLQHDWKTTLWVSDNSRLICGQLIGVAVGCLSGGSRWASLLRGAAAACRWAVGTLELRVRSIASGTAVKVFAALLLATPSLVETSTNFPGWCCSCGRRSCRVMADKWHWSCAHGGEGGGGPTH